MGGGGGGRSPLICLMRTFYPIYSLKVPSILCIPLIIEASILCIHLREPYILCISLIV